MSEASVSGLFSLKQYKYRRRPQQGFFVHQRLFILAMYRIRSSVLACRVGEGHKFPQFDGAGFPWHAMESGKESSPAQTNFRRHKNFFLAGWNARLCLHQPFSIIMTDVLSVPQWSQGFGDLHNLIAETLRSPSPPAIRSLRQGIEAYRPQFLQLLDDPPKNQEHRNTINSGGFDMNANLILLNFVY